jgi:VCBS repeat-containing protein
VDPAPVGVADSYAARENVPLIVPAASGVLANDTDGAGDVLTATLGTAPAHGTLTLNTDGSFTYTPAAGFSGTDQFTYIPHGSYVAGSSASVTITVAAGVAEAPAPPPPGTGDLASAPPGLLPGGGGEAGIVEAPARPPAVLASAPVVSQPAAAPVNNAGPARNAVPVASLTIALAPPVTLALTEVAPSAVASAGDIVPAGIAVPVTPLAIAPPLITLTPPPAALTPPTQVVIASTPPALPDPWSDATRLIAAPDPIMLPGFTLPGDETSALMLPVAPEISRLPEAFAAAAQRFTERPPAIVTYVDPLTGQPDDDDAPVSGGGQAWRLVDAWRDDRESEGFNDGTGPGGTGPEGTGLGGGDAGVMPSPIPGARIAGGRIPSRILWDSHPP